MTHIILFLFILTGLGVEIHTVRFENLSACNRALEKAMTAGVNKYNLTPKIWGFCETDH